MPNEFVNGAEGNGRCGSACGCAFRFGNDSGALGDIVAEVVGFCGVAGCLDAEGVSVDVSSALEK